MINLRTLNSVGAILISINILACASSSKTYEFPPGTDPQAKISEGDKKISEIKAKQYEFLSPHHFSDAQEELADARQSSEHAQPSEKTLNKVGNALEHIAAVETNGQANESKFSSVMDARKRAIDAQAHARVPEQFASADRDFADFGIDIEGGKTDVDTEKLSHLEKKYSSLELLALQNSNLDGVRSLIEKAENSGARSKAPKTLEEAKIALNTATKAIEVDRHDPKKYEPSVAQANHCAKKLNQVLKTVTDTHSSELAAIQIFNQQEEIASAKTQAEEEAKKAEEERNKVAALQGQNQQYASKEALNAKIASVRAEFQPKEADVLRDGNKIILRLKNLKFPTSRVELTSNSFGTLQKVKDMIQAVPASKVMVEGHTDSVGSAQRNLDISQKRAESVKNYLVSENTISEDKIEARGYGFEKPIESNKSKSGRAVNRRVDVVIETNTSP